MSVSAARWKKYDQSLISIELSWSYLLPNVFVLDLMCSFVYLLGEIFLVLVSGVYVYARARFD